MKTLLIDNYDSYTYNLFSLITEVNGEEPVVILNDAPDSAIPELTGFDNIVVSPGPGHPAEPRDFGIGARLLPWTGLPVLGVCLGHQGIAFGEQARVASAPEPRHGHLSTITHNGRDLFRKLPQGFTAVRYHSLSVREPLPPTLEAVAWAEDGVLMGLRHRTRPLWGVQFHPESVLTQFGHRLLANFRDLTVDHHRRGGENAASDGDRRGKHGHRPAPRRAADRTTSRPPAAPATPAPVAANGHRLHTRRVNVAVDTETAFTRMCADAPHAFWLDSARTSAGEARFSFFGDGTGPLAEFVRYDVETGVTEVERTGRSPLRLTESVFDYLKRRLAQRKPEPDGAGELPFDFTCGYVGYFGYEMKADCGSPVRHRATTPDACWLFADRLVAVDHREGAAYAVCLAEDTPQGLREATDWLDRTAARLSFLPPAPEGAAPPSATVETDAAVPWLVRDRKRYLADIEACQRELRAGTSYEICLTNAAWLPASCDSYDFYRTLRRRNPAPYAAYLKFQDLDVACSSPERFLRISRYGTAEAKPIKGTAPRSDQPREDARLRDSLAEDAKTRAENLMIVDLLRNDLSRVCTAGSVHVPHLMATETYATVHQLVSTVRGRLREGTDAVDAVRACFPGGSMTGAPKLRTMEIIDGLETEARGVYSGAIGYLSCNGAADLNIVIRTAVFTRGLMHLGAGGAIVLDSDPAAEYAEMLLKTAAPMQVYRDHPTRLQPLPSPAPFPAPVPEPEPVSVREPVR